MQNRPINPETIAAPQGPYNHAVEIPEGARVTFLSGQVGVDADGNLPDDFRSQAENAFANCQAILEHNGLRMKDVVKITQFLVRREDLPVYREVRGKYLGEERPGSTLLFVAGLADPKMLIEVEMVAAKLPA
jgi:enamine deaminase RidA (YjgF/YER057c/UK114 family)